MGRRPKEGEGSSLLKGEECTVARIRLHYQRLGLDQGWDVDHFYRLCRLLHCTEGELSALANLPKAAFTLALKRGHFSPECSLHFALLEAVYLDTVEHRLRGEPIMPIGLLAKKAEGHHHE